MDHFPNSGATADRGVAANGHFCVSEPLTLAPKTANVAYTSNDVAHTARLRGTEARKNVGGPCHSNLLPGDVSGQYAHLNGALAPMPEQATESSEGAPF